MAYVEYDDAYWKLTSSALAKRCQELAEEGSPVDPELHAEARRLHAGWQEALSMPDVEFDEYARRASRIASLRKRTIEILIMTYQNR